MTTDPANPVEEEFVVEPESASEKSTKSFIGAVGGIPAVLSNETNDSDAKRGGNTTPEYRSEGQTVRRHALPKRALVVLADKNYDQHELNVTLEHLKKHGFAPVITSDRKGKLHSRYNNSGNNGHVTIKQPLAEVSGQEYFSIVLMTGESSHAFKSKTPTGRQLQQQLRKTLQMHGAIVGMGAAQAIVTDESISGPIHYEDCDGLCIGDLKKGPGNVIKVAELKQIPKMVWQLNARFEEAKRKLSSK